MDIEDMTPEDLAALIRSAVADGIAEGMARAIPMSGSGQVVGCWPIPRNTCEAQVVKHYGGGG